MLFDSSFRKDLSRSFGVTLVVLLTIVMTIALIRTLGAAAGGKVAPQDVLLLLGFTGVGWLPLVLSLALFIAVVSTLTRMYRDSEMAVWLACGLPLRRLLAPLLRSAWPTVAAVVALVAFIGPWSAAQTQQLRERYEQRGDLSRVAPGQFQASRDGSKVFFIERDGDLAGVGRNVFILGQDGERESVTTAASGRIVWDEGDRYLVLQQGQHNEGAGADQPRALARFDEYRVLADRQGTRSLDALPPKAMPTMALLRSKEPHHQGQLTWRIGMGLGTLVLALLGLGLAATNPRRPSSWGLLLALLVFIVYFNLINLSEAWVAQGRMGAVQALLAVHGGALLVALLLLGWRDEAIRLQAWVRRRPA